MRYINSKSSIPTDGEAIALTYSRSSKDNLSHLLFLDEDFSTIGEDGLERGIAHFSNPKVLIKPEFELNLCETQGSSYDAIVCVLKETMEISHIVNITGNIHALFSSPPESQTKGLDLSQTISTVGSTQEKSFTLDTSLPKVRVVIHDDKSTIPLKERVRTPQLTLAKPSPRQHLAPIHLQCSSKQDCNNQISRYMISSFGIKLLLPLKDITSELFAPLEYPLSLDPSIREMEFYNLLYNRSLEQLPRIAKSILISLYEAITSALPGELSTEEIHEEYRNYIATNLSEPIKLYSQIKSYLHHYEGVTSHSLDKSPRISKLLSLVRENKQFIELVHKRFKHEEYDHA